MKEKNRKNIRQKKSKGLLFYHQSWASNGVAAPLIRPGWDRKNKNMRNGGKKMGYIKFDLKGIGLNGKIRTMEDFQLEVNWYISELYREQRKIKIFNKKIDESIVDKKSVNDIMKKYMSELWADLLLYAEDIC